MGWVNKIIGKRKVDGAPTCLVKSAEAATSCVFLFFLVFWKKIKTIVLHDTIEKGKLNTKS